VPTPSSFAGALRRAISVLYALAALLSCYFPGHLARRTRVPAGHHRILVLSSDTASRPYADRNLVVAHRAERGRRMMRVNLLLLKQ